jgi:protein O-mannosyl-transferase
MNKIGRYNKTLLAAIGTAVFTFLIYLPALQNSFVTWDDNVYIYENRMITSLDWKFIKWSFTEFAAFNWHPLTWVSHAIDYALWGLNPMGHHLTSILFHALNTFLVTLLAVRLWSIAVRDSAVNTIAAVPGGRPPSENAALIAGVVTGLLFGVHPLHVESVAWVSERKDVLSVFFFLLSVLSYLRYCARPLTPGDALDKSTSSPAFFFQKYYLLSIALFLLGILSKPMVVTLPVVLLLLDWYPLKRLTTFRGLVSLLPEKIPFFLASLFSVVVTVFAQRGALASVTGLPFSSRLLSAAKSLITYIEKMFWPSDLIPFYPYPVTISVFSAEYLVPVLVLIIITAACLYALKAKKQRIWLAVWGYYLITMLPVIGIIQVGKQELADRYTYLPSVGPFMLAGVAAGLLFIFLQKQKAVLKTVSLSVSFFILFSLSYATVRQIGVWKDGITLWSREIEVLAKQPGRQYLFLSIPFYNRGATYADQGKPDMAIEDFTMAIYLNPINFAAYYLRGAVYASKGMYEHALEDFNTSLYLNPGVPDVHYSRAAVLMRLLRYKEALYDLNEAIRLSPEPHAEYYYNRGLALRQLGYQNEAERDFIQAGNLGMGNVQKQDYTNMH